MKINFYQQVPQKLCFLMHIKNPHTVPGGWSKTKVKKRTFTSEEIMPFRVIFICFKLHCILCGETCSLKSDPRNPSRWRAAYLCKTASRGTGLSFKDSILEVCGRWKDAWANQVEVALQGAISDLPTAEARYHNGCRKNFMLFKIKEANTYASTKDTDLTFEKLVEDIISNKPNIWTSSEVHENYLLHGGKGCRIAVFAKLQKHFDDKYVVFSAPGLSILLVLHDTVQVCSNLLMTMMTKE